MPNNSLLFKGNCEVAAVQQDPPEADPIAWIKEKALPGSVAVRLRYATICGSDILSARETTSNIGATIHETVGVIVAVKEPCTVAVGDWVLFLTSEYAQGHARGQSEENIAAINALPCVGGATTELIYSHDSVCWKLPDSACSRISRPIWTAMQPLATVIWALRHLKTPVLGLDTLVLGVGQNGQLFSKMLSMMGARTVIAADLINHRADFAKQHFGATHAIHVDPTTLTDKPEIQLKQAIKDCTCGRGVSLVVEAVGHQAKSVELAGRLVNDGGSVLGFGVPDVGTMIDWHVFFRGNVSLIGTRNPLIPEDFEMARDFLQGGRLDPTPLYTHHFKGIEGLEQSFNMHISKADNIIKASIELNGE